MIKYAGRQEGICTGSKRGESVNGSYNCPPERRSGSASLSLLFKVLFRKFYNGASKRASSRCIVLRTVVQKSRGIGRALP